MVKLARSRTSVSPDTPQALFRMRIMLGGTIAIGPGKVALLEAIRECGSISAAAKRLEMSYKRAWDLLNEINRSLQQPAVDSEHGGAQGGGTVLTPVGEEVIRLYRSAELRAAKACADETEALIRLLARP
ncbi:winged helix-turn-helix domain-containing protein [Cupriavidus basilensis]|uniref:Winged helix-turn-helix domain-containing protein n=1 Tax=Cupriavidus basilensis TaxID=68895 RepID=A0ABT6AXW8_9BURK|nr:winged helix-turn-helix domain-containing protein [Cupriavidus basilensis]MDF3837464.1 winged helix-turn-helix domain-containing protein [Cupriavidus basilensis]